MKKVQEHFKIKDPILYQLSIKIPLNELSVSSDYFKDLVEDIVSQQLSDKAARTIYNRMVVQFPDRKPTPKLILDSPDESFRAAGLSRSKTIYIKDLSRRVLMSELQLDELTSRNNEEVIGELTKVKGIGPWTAEMFLMFSLGREDVFSPGDQGLKNAIKRLYKNKNQTPTWIEKLAEKWSPYRTYACLLLWRSNTITETDLQTFMKSTL